MKNTNLNSFFKYLAIGCGGLALLSAIAVVGLIMYFSTQPEGGVRLGGKVEKYAVRYIEEHEILEPGEKILAYYDATTTLDGSEAAILTDRRLIQYTKGVTESVRLEEVEDIRHRKETLIGDIIEAEDSNGTIIMIEIAPLNQGESFKNAAIAAWKKARKEAGHETKAPI